MSKLICLSGLDGSGKTTQVALLKNHFQANGLRVNILQYQCQRLKKGASGMLKSER